MLLHLPLETDFKDYSGHQLQGAMNNEVVLKDGGAYFSGKETWLDFPHVPLDQRPFSIAMWIKLTGEKPMYGLLTQQASRRRNEWLHLMLRGGRQPYLGFCINDAISPQPIPGNEWVHLVFAHDKVWQMIWINGKPVCSRKSGPYKGERGKTRIGWSPRWTNVPSVDFEGYLKDIRIYDRVLSTGAIQTLAGMPEEARHSKPHQRLNPSAENFQTSGDPARDFGVPFLSMDGRKMLITGESGQVYEIQATDDLTRGQWERVSVLTNRLGTLKFEDPAAQDHRHRFYRINFLRSKRGGYWTW
ncbi:MAG: LamG domain-containing protein [Verrucomicrobiota bacterium]